MNKLLNFAQRLEPQSGTFSTSVVDPPSDTINSDSQLLDYIYSVDPVTSLPCGDLAIYLGDKANPEIRNFIEMNLLQPRSDGKSVMDIPQDVLNKMKSVIGDDDIATFSRNHDESREEYADRMKLYFLNEKKRRRQEGYLKEVEGLLNKSDND